MNNEELLKALKSLVEKRYVISETTEDDKEYFFNSSRILVNRYDSECRSLKEAAERYLITADVHNSEVKNRKEIEDSFKEGKTNILVSTSTLEMGIDIGELTAFLW